MSYLKINELCRSISFKKIKLEYFKKSLKCRIYKGPIIEQKILDNIMSKANNKNKKINDKEYKELEQKTFNINKVIRMEIN